MNTIKNFNDIRIFLFLACLLLHFKISILRNTINLIQCMECVIMSDVGTDNHFDIFVTYIFFKFFLVKLFFTTYHNRCVLRSGTYKQKICRSDSICKNKTWKMQLNYLQKIYDHYSIHPKTTIVKRY